MESVAVTSISIFVIHWTWKRLSPCMDSSQEHDLVMQQKIAKQSQSASEKSIGNPQGSYFGVTAPPPLILHSESREKDLRDNNSVGVYHNSQERVRFSVNTSYSVNNGQAEGNSVPDSTRISDMTYQQQQQGDVGGSANYWAVRDKLFFGKQVLLVLMTFVLGLELGFKFASRTVIYLLNPCHITTIMQVSGCCWPTRCY